MLQVCLSGCCICFTHMLQVFNLNVAYVSNGFMYFFGVFASISDACFNSTTLSVFRHMLQVLYRNVLKVDWGITHIAT